jgi:predicted oxidoreductase
MRHIIVCLSWLLVACQGEIPRNDADVIVVGAGIAGISAALEASEAGATVLIIEASSMAGGHAVKAGGFALVGTPLQERKGWTDTPDIAFRDLMAWGEDADPHWVRAYAENSRVEVYDWLVEHGVKFVVVLNTPEDTVPRFHFTRGTAVHAMVPLLRAALETPRIRFLMNNAAEELLRSGPKVVGVRIRDTRTGLQRDLHAGSVVLATGGFQSNLDMVRANWRSNEPGAFDEPEQLLIGSGHRATGTGIKLGEEAGAGLSRMDRQVTFVNGLPDPRNPGHGLSTQNSAAIRIDAGGRRFVDETADSKEMEAAVMNLTPQTHWLIFDAQGRRRLRIRGATWLNPDTIEKELLDNPAVTHQAATIAELAVAAGLPPNDLRGTVDRHNAIVADVGAPARIVEPPFYAMQLYPMTRKSMGGLAIDRAGRVVDAQAEPIPGLYAAGELTGVAGINGSHGGSGTFLGPSVFTGRIAGRSAAAKPADDTKIDKPAVNVADNSNAPMADMDQLVRLLKRSRSGYWHFEQSHARVIERNYACGKCHSADWPTIPATGPAQRLAQLDSCTECH